MFDDDHTNFERLDSIRQRDVACESTSNSSPICWLVSRQDGSSHESIKVRSLHPAYVRMTLYCVVRLADDQIDGLDRASNVQEAGPASWLAPRHCLASNRCQKFIHALWQGT